MLLCSHKHLLFAILFAGLLASMASPSDALPLDPRSILKTYFETGDVPTEDQFVDLIDSFFDLTFTFGSFNDGHTISARAGGISDFSGRALVLGAGETIGPGQSYASTASVGSLSSWPGQSGFLGFEFEIDTPGVGVNTHYGFLQMSVDGPGSATPFAIHVTGVAYETTPNTPVQTAAIAAVPEPSSYAMAMLSLLGLAVFWRRVARPRR